MSRSWWVFLFLGCLSLFYFYSIHRKELLSQELQRRLHSLEKEKELVLMQQEELLLQVKSQSDPMWIKMILMKELGLVPRGQVKVYFKR